MAQSLQATFTGHTSMPLTSRTLELRHRFSTYGAG